MNALRRSFLLGCTAVSLAGCEYGRLLRPSVLKQLDPDVARLVNELPEVDHPNEELLARLYATGGLRHAQVGSDGVMRQSMSIPVDQFIWKPAIVVMPRGGDLELDVTNEDHNHHMAFMPSDGERQVLDLPPHTRGRIRVRLDHPGYYWFGCPVADHVGRGMLGFIFVKGELPPGARLDRPPQPQPGDRRPPHEH
jgi:PQQ system protein